MEGRYGVDAGTRGRKNGRRRGRGERGRIFVRVTLLREFFKVFLFFFPLFSCLLPLLFFFLGEHFLKICELLQRLCDLLEQRKSHTVGHSTLRTRQGCQEQTTSDDCTTGFELSPLCEVAKLETLEEHWKKLTDCRSCEFLPGHNNTRNDGDEEGEV